MITKTSNNVRKKQNLLILVRRLCLVKKNNFYLAVNTRYFSVAATV